MADSWTLLVIGVAVCVGGNTPLQLQQTLVSRLYFSGLCSHCRPRPRVSCWLLFHLAPTFPGGEL